LLGWDNTKYNVSKILVIPGHEGLGNGKAGHGYQKQIAT